MLTTPITQGELTTKDNINYGIVISRFNEFIVDQLLKGALETFERFGVPTSCIQTFKVPGAFEIPLTALAMAQTQKYHAIIALGAIIKGSTPHFDVVASESAKGLAQVGMQCQLPVINGILTTNTIEQAIERAGTKAGNKGAESAISAIEMVSIIKKIRQS